MVPAYPAENQSAFVHGKWKDGLFNCCAYGAFHPHLWLAWCCKPLALAQVMVRMRLNWCGSPDGVAAVASTFKRVAVIYLLYLLIRYSIGLAMQAVLPAATVDDQGYIVYPTSAPVAAIVLDIVSRICGVLFFIYLAIATTRTRRSVREKYSIPEESCSGCEDPLCVFSAHAVPSCKWLVTPPTTRNIPDNAAPRLAFPRMLMPWPRQQKPSLVLYVKLSI